MSMATGKSSFIGSDIAVRMLSRTVFTILFLFSYVSVPQAAVHRNYDITVTLKQTQPKYYSVPAETVQNFCQDAEYIPVGCTYYKMAYDFTYSYNYKASASRGHFRNIKIDMKFYYDDFAVYIDDKYLKGSCEYNAIKKHENLHVKIDQKVEIGKVKEAIEECIIAIEENAVAKKEVDDAIKSCVKRAFDLDEEIRKNKNKELDADKSKQPNFTSDC